MHFRPLLPASTGSAGERKNLLVNCLRRNDLELQNFFDAAFNELFREEYLAAVHKFIGSDERAESYLQLLANSDLRSLLSEPLFLLILKKTITKTPLAERFLTRLRKGLALLQATLAMEAQDYRLMAPLACALAQQCFWNEYVFQISTEESGSLAEIAEQLRTADSLATEKSILSLAILACYAPLNTYDLAEKLPAPESITDQDFLEMLRVQLFETQEEKKIWEQIQSFSAINDDVSQLVRQQYEENPYPRWTGISLAPPKPFIVYLRQEIAPNSPADLLPVESPEVLIAGGGTGRQPISCAVTYLNASVIAIDLSRASLAYAKRKANELGIRNIEFLQGDILALHNLGKTFDVIECSGVLHHMSNPKQGLRILVDLLRPAGYMRIGLYSELARQHIVAAREFVKNHGYPATMEGIRACRQALLALPDESPAKKVTIGQDFYSTSTVRDLIFHVQEHRFTLPEIARLLEEFNLEFLGFDLGAEVKNTYLAQFPNDHGATSLANWHQYEMQNPAIFFGMYNLTVRKKTAE